MLRGGSLALPTSRHTQQQYVDAINKTFGSNSIAELFWINLELDKNNNPLSKIKYSNWDKDQPSSSSSPCVALMYDVKGVSRYKHTKWNDRWCSDKLGYVCQFEGKLSRKLKLLSKNTEIWV